MLSVYSNEAKNESKTKESYMNIKKNTFLFTLRRDVLSTSWKGAGSMWHLLKSTSLLSSSSSHLRCSSKVISIIRSAGFGKKTKITKTVQENAITET